MLQLLALVMSKRKDSLRASISTINDVGLTLRHEHEQRTANSEMRVPKFGLSFAQKAIVSVAAYRGVHRPISRSALNAMVL